MKPARPMVINLQRYCVHDGDGIRSTVFFKGCPLRCSWCHNPETQAFRQQRMFYPERCTGCGSCTEVCPHALPPDFEKCAACGDCAAACSFGAQEIVGQPYEIDELVRLLLRDEKFYDNSGGGVTLSGGEPLAQEPGYIKTLLQRLRRRGVHTAVDTCGDVPWEHFAAVLPHTSVFLFDLKTADPALHERATGRDNTRILANLRRLAQEGACINLRVPVIGGVNDADAEQCAMAAIAAAVQPHRVNLLPYHRTGRDKLERLGLAAKDLELFTPSEARMEELCALWQAAGFTETVIGG